MIVCFVHVSVNREWCRWHGSCHISVLDADVTLVSASLLQTSLLSLSSCGENADGLGGQGDRMKEGRDRKYPGVTWRVS